MNMRLDVALNSDFPTLLTPGKISSSDSLCTRKYKKNFSICMYYLWVSPSRLDSCAPAPFKNQKHIRKEFKIIYSQARVCIDI